VGVFANLMPDEVVASRRARVVKRYVLLGLAAVLFLLATAFGLTWWQTQSAQGDLSAAQDQATALQHRQREFQPLVTAQGQSTQIHTILGKLMVGDLQWTHLLDTVRASAKGISITGLTGAVTVGAAAPVTGAPGTSGGITVLNQTGQLQVGTMTISGIARDKNAVAAFVDTLGKVPGLAGGVPGKRRVDERQAHLLCRGDPDRRLARWSIHAEAPHHGRSLTCPGLRRNASGSSVVVCAPSSWCSSVTSS